MPKIFIGGSGGISFAASNKLLASAGSGHANAVLTISNLSIAENANVGTTIGALSVTNPNGVYTYTKTADPDSKFVISGSNLNLANTLNYEAATSHSVTIQANNGVSPISRTFAVQVTNVLEGTLGPTTASFDAGTTAGTTIATITGLDGGSNEYITSIAPNDGRIAIAGGGTSLVVGLAATSAGSISLTATTSQSRTLNIAVTINSASATIPSIQTVSFGAKTLRGHGGHALSYTGGGTLSITGGNGSGFWAIDSRNHLVLAGTYNSAPPALSTGNGAYTLTVSDGTSTSTVTVNVVPYEYSVRSIATGTNADALNSFQLRTVINSGSAINFGDTIRLRDGSILNDDMSIDMRVRKGSQFTQRSGGPVAPTSANDTGWVKITAETPKGATIRRLMFEGNTVANHYLWLDNIRLERFNTTALSGSAGPIVVTSTAGSKWFKVTNCLFKSRIESGTVATNTNIFSGISFTMKLATPDVITQSDFALTGNFYINDNEFEDLYDGISLTGSTVEVIGNKFRRVWNDCVKGGYQDWKMNWNFMTDKVYGDGGLHGDFFQLIQNTFAPGTYIGGEHIGNIMTRGVGRSGFGDGQGIFLSSSPTVGISFTGVVIRGNLYVGTFANGIDVENAVDPVVEWNTIVCDRGPGALNTAVRINFAGGTDRGVIRYNAVTNSTTTFLQEPPSGAPTVSNPQIVTPNIVNLNDDTKYAAAFASPAYGTANDTMEEALANWAMKPGGSLDMATTGHSAHCGAVGTGYINFNTRTTNFPDLTASPPTEIANTRSIQFPPRNGDGYGRALTGPQLTNIYGNGTAGAAGAIAYRCRIQPGSLNTSPSASTQTITLAVGGNGGATVARGFHMGFGALGSTQSGVRGRFYFGGRDFSGNYLGDRDATGASGATGSTRYLRTPVITTNNQGSWNGLVVLRRNSSGEFSASLVGEDGTVYVGDSFTPSTWIGLASTSAAFMLGSIPSAAATYGNWFPGDMCDFIQLDGTHGTDSEWSSIALGADPSTVFGGNLAAHYRLSGPSDLSKTSGSRSYAAFTETTSGSPVALALGPQLRPARNASGAALLARPQYTGYTHALSPDVVTAAANRTAVTNLTGSVVRDVLITGPATHVEGRALNSSGVQLVGWTRVTSSAATGYVETKLDGVKCGEVIMEYRREDDTSVISVMCDHERVGLVMCLDGQSQTYIGFTDGGVSSLDLAPNYNTSVSYCIMRGSGTTYNPVDGGFIRAKKQLSEGMTAVAHMLDALGTDIPVEFVSTAISGTNIASRMYRFNGDGNDMCGDGIDPASGFLTSIVLAKRKRITGWLYSWSTSEASTRNGGSTIIGSTFYGARGPVTELPWIDRLNEFYGGVEKSTADSTERSERRNLHDLGFTTAWNPWVIMLPVSRHRYNSAGAAPADTQYGPFRLQQYDAAINQTGKAGNWRLSLGAFQIDTFMTPENESAHQARTDIRGNIRYDLRYAQALAYAAKLSTLDPRPRLTTAAGVGTNVVTISTTLVNGGSLVTETDGVTPEQFEVSENNGAWSKRDGAIAFTPAIVGNTVTLTRSTGTWHANTKIRYLSGWPVAVGGTAGNAAAEGDLLNGVLYETRADAIPSTVVGLRAGVPLMPTWTDITAT